MNKTMENEIRFNLTTDILYTSREPNNKSETKLTRK